ncbi:MAG: uncharacterized protein JWM57_2574 [Phycisphaerales bacterium]|nr:uncharacterized protein [Phycisphaerales bacterium]
MDRQRRLPPGLVSSRPLLGLGRAAELRRAMAIIPLLASFSVADTYVWDPGVTGSSNGGGSGTWNATLANWHPSAGTGDVAWPGSTETAMFAGSGGTVSLGSAISAFGLNFTAAGYTVAGSSAVLSLGAGGITTASGTTTINTAVALTAAQSWNVLGQLTLGGTVSGGQPLTLASGNLFIGDGATNGSIGNTNVAISSGATLNFNRSDTVTYSGVVTGAGTGRLTHAGSGVLNLNGGTAATPNAPGQFFVTGGGTANISGTFNTNGSSNQFSVSSGTVNWDATGTQSVLYFGVGDSNTTTSAGVFNLNSGTLNVSAAGGTTPTLFIGNSKASGLMKVAGGALNLTSGNLQIGAGASVSFGSLGGTLTIDSGNFTASGSSGLFQLGPDSKSGSTPVGTGIVNLNGGTLATARTIKQGNSPNAVGIFNFNGGTLQATGSTLAMSGLTANVLNGAVLDTNGYSITIAQNLSHGGTGTDGGLTKNGVGTLCLTGSSTYNGPTNINTGMLLANGVQVSSGGAVTASSTGTGTVFINSGTMLAGTGAASAVVVKSGGTLTAGNGPLSTNSVGTLTTGDQTWNNGGTLAVKFAKTGSVLAWDQIHMGALNLPAVTAGAFKISLVDISNAFPATAAGSYTLATVTGYTLPSGFSGGTNLTSLFTLDSSGLLNAGTYTIQSGGSGSAQTLDLVVNGGAQTAPEPGTTLMFGLAGGTLITRRRRTRLTQSAAGPTVSPSRRRQAE